MSRGQSDILISVVSPVYKAEKIVDELVSRLVINLDKITSNFEIILVEDGGPDNSWERIEEICNVDNRVKGIKLSRNFGQHNAITAGLKSARGEWTVVMDCDLQDRPEEIVNFYNKAIEGFDLVVGKKRETRDSFSRKIESYFFNAILEKLTGVKVEYGIGNFGIYQKKVIQSYLELNEEYRSFGMMIIWLGFKRFELEIESDTRFEGKSSYTFLKKLHLALTTIISFSGRTLTLIISIGLGISFFSILFLVIYLLEVWVNAQPLKGWTSVIISIFFSLGLLMSSIGIVGLYVAKIFSQVKQRPLFVVTKAVNNESN